MAIKIKDLIEIILYLAPGFIALELYRGVYPSKERNQFIQIAWSIIYGLIIFALVRWIDKDVLNFALHSQNTDFPHILFILALLLGGIIFGSLRIFFDYLRFKLSTLHDLLNWIAPDPQSIWSKVNHKSNKDWAVVFLKDDSIYMGWISRYTYNPDNENQDFLLTKAIRVDEDLKTKYVVVGKGVYINNRDVNKIEFVNGVNNDRL